MKTGLISNNKFQLRIDGRNFTLYEMRVVQPKPVEGAVPPPPVLKPMFVGHFGSIDMCYKKCIALNLARDEVQSFEEVIATINRVSSELKELFNDAIRQA